MESYGELIALSTVLCWTVSIQFFEAASKRIGAIPVNTIRVSIALILFASLLLIREGAVIPIDFPIRAWVLLSLSGVVGFFIGDIFLFKALVDLGPRITMLIQSLAAPAAAIIGWLFLSETYLFYQWFGMLVTLGGVSLVILERGENLSSASKLRVRKISFTGVVYGFLAMVGQAGGLVLSKMGMQTESGYLDAFSSTQIRIIASFVCLLVFFTITGRWGSLQGALHDKKAVVFTSVGSVVGPFLGVSLSLLALHHMSTGVAATFFAMIPICIIPFSVFLHKEHVSFRAICGALIAVSGVYILMSC